MKLDVKILKNDWTIVRDCIKKLQETLENPRKTEYPKNFEALRGQNELHSTAHQNWPNPPRVRLNFLWLITIYKDT
ncbi:hypothetical protein CW304_12145 [Bacillus sp. UFRGS-B20]|nr:hypothetical protein CW304_12145 [Bacillus sp. UFRGS-B20]